MIRRGEPIIGGGAGTGLSAKCEEAGGIDLIVIYNSGRYRMAGRGSLAGLMAYGNANEIVLDMAREVLPVVKRTPVLAGVNGTDPFMITRRLPAPAGRARLLRGAELPHRGPLRRDDPRPARGDRDGLRPRGRDDPGRPRARPADHALRVLGAERGGHGQGGRRHRGVPPGPHDRRRHRRRDRAQAHGLRPARRVVGGRGPVGERRTSSCCATAGRSPGRPTRATS